MQIIDNFLPQETALEIRAEGINASYVDWLGPDGQVYKRIAIHQSDGVQKAIEEIYGIVNMLGMGYRLNYNDELPNAAIHSDIGWGTHALVYYLNETEEDLGGTAFWTHRQTGASLLEPTDAELLTLIESDWDNEKAWDMYDYVPLKWNRALMYESKMFHSRYPFEAFGDSPSTGRLIMVAFFTPLTGGL